MERKGRINRELRYLITSISNICWISRPDYADLRISLADRLSHWLYFRSSLELFIPAIH